MLSSFLIKDEGYAANVQQKSSAESQVTITFVESSSEHEQLIRKDFHNIEPGRSSKKILPSTGSKMSGALFILGILAFFLSVTILLIRIENRRNKL
ncbi:LPXTG cell wall anchor domain-containing protein [Enterococcus faecalis]|nr:LPXTG cell wall anchor domain-containing protein [Enterococcus faecalis]NSR46628.1 LPXTG cell wall anchor domain-containing protein [Enterococcus faecalis]HBI1780647.1 LPXTG cell wall anchor domain-containing protein [Enterococcus faecalis]